MATGKLLWNLLVTGPAVSVKFYFFTKVVLFQR